MLTKNKWIVAAVATCGLFVAATAPADTLNVGDTVYVKNGLGANPPDNQRYPTNWFLSIKLTTDGNLADGFWTNTGVFDLAYSHDKTNWTQFLAFCLQLDQNLEPLGSGTTYLVAGGLGSNLSELWGRNYGDISGDLTAAAFQIAIYEIVSGDPTLNVFGGNFRVLNNGNSGLAGAQAQEWLDALDGLGPMASLLWLQSGNHQDLLTGGGEVPEPASLALLGLGLLGLGLAKRRRVN